MTTLACFSQRRLPLLFLRLGITMKVSRRLFLSGVCAAALFSGRAEARVLHGGVAIGHGWNTLPLGAGGLVTGMHIANDGAMVCRTDVGNIYRWSGTSADYADPSQKWNPLLTFSSLGSSATATTNYGGYEHVLAPGNSSVHVAIFPDMAGASRTLWIWYSTDSGATWKKSNISLTYAAVDIATSANSNASLFKTCNYKIVVDPANENVAYCGMPLSSGNSAGVYTSLNQAGGSTLATWTSVKTSGAIPVGAVSNALSCGLAIDASSGTTTVGGQTVTSRIILPVGGVGIYESTDGGVTFSEIAATAFGTANFFVPSGGFTAEGVYYCVVVHATAGGVWRYAAGTWTKISPSRYSASTFTRTTFLIIDPRSNPASKAYLSVSGPNGIGAGFTSTNANTGSPPTWAGRTGGEFPYLKAPSFDIPYLNYIVGQQARSAFAYATNTCVDSNGVCFWGGNQSLWYFGTSDVDPTPSGLPNFGSSIYTYSWSLGRGMEVTVTQDALCPPGGTYPVLALQDIGAPARGTFTTYPKDIALHFLEYTCQTVEYAASDPSFIVARATGQNADNFVDASCYSPSYGADGTWTRITNTPTRLWQGSFRATISNGRGGAGNILTVTSITSGTIMPNSGIFSAVKGAGTFYGRTMPYGTSGTTGAGGIGTYILAVSSSVLTPTGLFSAAPVQGGQTVAIDRDHWVTVPSGLSQHYIPAYTTNATGAATWALCTGLPAKYWTMRPWVNGPTSKPFAVGYGADLGVVWACLFDAGTATLYRSTDSGASFGSIATWSVSTSVVGIYCLSVPGFPNELWITGSYTGGTSTSLWRVTNANSTSAKVTSISLPALAALPLCFTLGAPSSGGEYPALYLLGWSTFNATQYLYRGAWNGTTVTWSLFGPTGTRQDLPESCQLCGIQAIRGDWNVYGRLYVSSNQSGFAYYNP